MSETGTKAWRTRRDLEGLEEHEEELIEELEEEHEEELKEECEDTAEDGAAPAPTSARAGVKDSLEEDSFK